MPDAWPDAARDLFAVALAELRSNKNAAGHRPFDIQWVGTHRFGSDSDADEVVVTVRLAGQSRAFAEGTGVERIVSKKVPSA